MLEHMYHKPLLKEEELLATLHEYRDMVAPYVGDVSLFLDKAIKEGKKILLEGQLGTLKDPDHGIYPMVTSSSTLAAYGAIGAGIPPYEIKKIVTVSKAYSSAVGAGAFVSEIFGDEADELRRRGGDGGEFGATTDHSFIYHRIMVLNELWMGERKLRYGRGIKQLYPRFYRRRNRMDLRTTWLDQGW